MRKSLTTVFCDTRRPASERVNWLGCVASLAVLAMLACSTEAVAAQQAPGSANSPGAAGSPQQETNQSGSPQTSAESDPNRVALLERLTAEVAALTPGNLEQPPELKSEVTAAVTLLLEGKVEPARQKLDELRAKHPELPPVQLTLAAVYFAINNNQEGLRLLEEAATGHPDLPTIYNAFSRLAIAQRRRTDALALLDKARAKIDSGKWSELERGHFELAWLDAMSDLMMMRRDFGEARKYLDQILSRKPEDPRTVMRLAEVDFSQDKQADCLKGLQRFSELNPERPSPELMMATLLAASKRLPEADEWVEKARKAQPENPKVLIDYANWMLDREKFTEASSALEALQKVNPDQPAGSLLRAKVAFAGRDYAEAERLLGELRVSDPGNPDVANLWAMALAENPEQSKRQRALEVAAQNAQLQPQNPVAAAILGWVLFRQDDLNQAREWFGRASQSQRLTPEMAYFLAKFLQSSGQKEQALQLVTQALEQPGLFLYRTSARELRKELIGGN
ncbi:MAG: tetratricopeptide repeat protein [Planctomycetota bacterium]|jgi:predicted Zn-dependent protease